MNEPLMMALAEMMQGFIAKAEAVEADRWSCNLSNLAGGSVVFALEFDVPTGRGPLHVQECVCFYEVEKAVCPHDRGVFIGGYLAEQVYKLTDKIFARAPIESNNTKATTDRFGNVIPSCPECKSASSVDAAKEKQARDDEIARGEWSPILQEVWREVEPGGRLGKVVPPPENKPM